MVTLVLVLAVFGTVGSEFAAAKALEFMGLAAIVARSSEQVFGIEKAPVLSIFPHLSDEQRIIENIVLRNVLFIFQPLSV